MIRFPSKTNYGSDHEWMKMTIFLWSEWAIISYRGTTETWFHIVLYQTKQISMKKPCTTVSKWIYTSTHSCTSMTLQYFCSKPRLEFSPRAFMLATWPTKIETPTETHYQWSFLFNSIVIQWIVIKYLGCLISGSFSYDGVIDSYIIGPIFGCLGSK